MPPPCRHCHRCPVSRPRGLCWRCYYTPGLRDLYPDTSIYAPKSGDCYGGYGLPAAPTDAAPGSPEKVRVLVERARSRQCLWHPGDATFAGPKRKEQKGAG